VKLSLSRFKQAWVSEKRHTSVGGATELDQDGNGVVVVKILTYTREMPGYADTERCQLVFVANAGKLEELWRVYSSS
jgi:hypothetical protein